MAAQLIQPIQQGLTLVRDIETARQAASPDHFDIWWLGQSGFLIHWNGRTLLFDPYLSDSLTKKYQHTPKPHTRLSELVIAPELLTGIDVVTSSHNHTDHLDAETLIPLFQNNRDIRFVIPEANRSFVADRAKCDIHFPLGINDGETQKVKGFTFHGVPAAHNELERDEQGRCKYMGYVVQFGKWSLYHSGDTLWYEGMVDILRKFDLDVAFLPINGNDPSRGVAGNLNAHEAVLLGKAIGAKLVIPHHYDLFAFNTTDPGDFVAEGQKEGIRFQVLKMGERLKWRTPNDEEV